MLRMGSGGAQRSPIIRRLRSLTPLALPDPTQVLSDRLPVGGDADGESDNFAKSSGESGNRAAIVAMRSIPSRARRWIAREHGAPVV